MFFISPKNFVVILLYIVYYVNTIYIYVYKHKRLFSSFLMCSLEIIVKEDPSPYFPGRDPSPPEDKNTIWEEMRN